MTAPYLEQIPSELAFATPGDWFALRVPKQPADADTLPSQILAAQPRLTRRREAVERMARGLVTACAQLDVLCAYTTALDVPGGPLPATVLANAYPLNGLTVFQLAEQMSGDEGAELARFTLPVGPTARIERLQEWDGPDGDQRIVFLVVHYIAEIPGSGIAIMLTVATPALALAVELRRLFHQIACTLQFTPPEQR